LESVATATAQPRLPRASAHHGQRCAATFPGVAAAIRHHEVAADIVCPPLRAAVQRLRARVRAREWIRAPLHPALTAA
jgi:hypothetical protein